VIPASEVVNVVDNIGLPYSGINLAYSTSAPVGPGDADIYVNLSRHHKPTATYVRALRSRLSVTYPSATFAFLPADMMGQILNFGLPSPIDVQIVGFDAAHNREFANNLLQKLRGVPGAVDLHIQQSPTTLSSTSTSTEARRSSLDSPNRRLQATCSSPLSGSFQTAPSFWTDPKSGTSTRTVDRETPAVPAPASNDSRQYRA